MLELGRLIAIRLDVRRIVIGFNVAGVRSRTFHPVPAVRRIVKNQAVGLLFAVHHDHVGGRECRRRVLAVPTVAEEQKALRIGTNYDIVIRWSADDLVSFDPAVEARSTVYVLCRAR